MGIYGDFDGGFQLEKWGYPQEFAGGSTNGKNPDENG